MRSIRFEEVIATLSRERQGRNLFANNQRYHIIAVFIRVRPPEKTGIAKLFTNLKLNLKRPKGTVRAKWL